MLYAARAVVHAALGLVLCITLVGIPLGVGQFRHASTSLRNRRKQKLMKLATRPTDSRAAFEQRLDGANQPLWAGHGSHPLNSDES